MEETEIEVVSMSLLDTNKHAVATCAQALLSYNHLSAHAQTLEYNLKSFMSLMSQIMQP